MKSNILKVIIALIFLALFNGIFFYVGGTEQTEVNWVCYGFIHVAYLSLLITPLFCKSGKGMTILSASLYLRGLFYFFTELVVGLICIAIAPESPTWPLIIQGVLLAIFLVLQLMSILANDSTYASMQKQKVESEFIQDMAHKLKICMHNVNDANMRKQVERCYDAVNNSSIQSYPEAQDVELSLRNAVEMLCSAVEDGDNEQIIKRAKNVLFAVQDRNEILRKCRMNY